MDNVCIMIEDKDVYEAIKKQLNNSITVVCGKCGAVKCDTKKLAKELVVLISKTSNDEAVTSIEDEGSTILSAIIEIEPAFNSMTANEWARWDAEHDGKKCGFLKDYEQPVYVIATYVCLFYNKDCDCFAEFKKNILEIH